MISSCGVIISADGSGWVASVLLMSSVVRIGRSFWSLADNLIFVDFDAAVKALGLYAFGQLWRSY